MTTTAPVSTTRASPFSRRRLVLIAVSAAIINLAAFLVAGTFGASMIVSSPQQMQLTAVVVIAATVVPLIGAGLVTWLIARAAPGFRRVAAWVGLALAILSCASPLLVSEDVTTGIALGAMHLIAGVSWYIALMTGRAAR